MTARALLVAFASSLITLLAFPAAAMPALSLTAPGPAGDALLAKTTWLALVQDDGMPDGDADMPEGDEDEDEDEEEPADDEDDILIPANPDEEPAPAEPTPVDDLPEPDDDDILDEDAPEEEAGSPRRMILGDEERAPAPEAEAPSVGRARRAGRTGSDTMRIEAEEPLYLGMDPVVFWTIAIGGGVGAAVLAAGLVSGAVVVGGAFAGVPFFQDLLSFLPFFGPPPTETGKVTVTPH